jgi:hypothetical protein
VAHSREFPETSLSEIASALGTSKWNSIPVQETAVKNEFWVVLISVGCQLGSDESQAGVPAFDRHFIATVFVHNETVVSCCNRSTSSRQRSKRYQLF